MASTDNNHHQSDRKQSRSFDNNDECLSASNKKMKQLVADKDFHLLLIVILDGADGVDVTTPQKSERFYRVIVWVNPGRQLITEGIVGDPNIVWNKWCKILLDRSLDCRFLHVEVIRHEFPANDPGTSYGHVSVGKAQIPLPTLKASRKEGRYELVRVDGDRYKPEGHLTMAMELEKIDYN